MRRRRARGIVIDKSVLTFGEPERVRNPEYLSSRRGGLCEVDPAHDSTTVVACHVRLDGAGGMGLKPGDDLVLFLCSDCHDEMDGRRPGLQGAAFIVARIVLPWLRRRFLEWAAECPL